MTEVNEERMFLHDIANPLGTAMFLADVILDQMQNKPGVPSEEIAQMVQLYQALEKVKKLLAARRDILIKRGVPGAGA